jgi:hypothetical protein
MTHFCFQTSPLLRLKYFIILTSKREIYPTIGNDKNQGIFRTVLFTMSGGTPTATPPRSPNSQEEKDTALALLAAAGSELVRKLMIFDLSNFRLYEG